MFLRHFCCWEQGQFKTSNSCPKLLSENSIGNLGLLELKVIFFLVGGINSELMSGYLRLIFNVRVFLVRIFLGYFSWSCFFLGIGYLFGILTANRDFNWERKKKPSIIILKFGAYASIKFKNIESFTGRKNKPSSCSKKRLFLRKSPFSILVYDLEFLLGVSKATPLSKFSKL